MTERGSEAKLRQVENLRVTKFVYSGERMVAAKLDRGVPLRRRPLGRGWVDAHSEFERPCTECGSQGDIDTVVRVPGRPPVRLCSDCADAAWDLYLSALADVNH